jgi:hypothetical protein
MLPDMELNGKAQADPQKAAKLPASYCQSVALGEY